MAAAFAADEKAEQIRGPDKREGSVDASWPRCLSLGTLPQAKTSTLVPLTGKDPESWFNDGERKPLIIIIIIISGRPHANGLQPFNLYSPS